MPKIWDQMTQKLNFSQRYVRSQTQDLFSVFHLTSSSFMVKNSSSCPQLSTTHRCWGPGHTNMPCWLWLTSTDPSLLAGGSMYPSLQPELCHLEGLSLAALLTLACWLALLSEELSVHPQGCHYAAHLQVSCVTKRLMSCHGATWIEPWAGLVLGVQRRLCGKHGQQSWWPSLFPWWQEQTWVQVLHAEHADKSEDRFRPGLDLMQWEPPTSLTSSHCREPFHTPTYYQQSLTPSTRIVSWKIIALKKTRPWHLPPSTQNFNLPHREKASKICSISLSMRNNLASRNYQHGLILWTLKAKPRDKLDHMSFPSFY